MYLGPLRAYTHNGDHNLLSCLGLKTSGFNQEFTDLGTVAVQEATVKVEVSALPAQFWKFTITRPVDDGESDGVEIFLMETGSGGFTDYWPMAEAFANNMVQVNQIGGVKS